MLTNLGRERHARYGLQYRALPRGLVTTDNDLRQVNEAAETLGSQRVNDVQQVPMVLGLQQSTSDYWRRDHRGLCCLILGSCIWQEVVNRGKNERKVKDCYFIEESEGRLSVLMATFR